MGTERFSRLFLVALAVFIGLSCSAAATGQNPIRRVAITFDDLPGGGGLTAEQRCDAAAVLSVSTRLLAPFRENDWPMTGFVLEGNLCDKLESSALDAVLEAWLDVGAALGNHTYSHPDLNNLSVEAFTEFMYAAVYARALAHGDAEMMSTVLKGYLSHLEVSVYYEDLSVRRFGRAIPHVLLLHANALNADHIGEVLSLLRARGYVFESLESVLRDDVYGREDHYVGPVGLTWIHRWFEDGVIESKNEPRGSDEIEELFRTYPAND